MLSLFSTGLRVKATIATAATAAAAFIIIRGGPAAIDLSAEASTAVDGSALTTNYTSLQWAAVPGQAVLDTPAVHDIGPLQGDLPASAGPVMPADRWNGPAATVLSTIKASGLLAVSRPLPAPLGIAPVDLDVPLPPDPQGVVGVDLPSVSAQIAIMTAADNAPSDTPTLPAVNSYPLNSRASGS